MKNNNRSISSSIRLCVYVYSRHLLYGCIYNYMHWLHLVLFPSIHCLILMLSPLIRHTVCLRIFVPPLVIFVLFLFRRNELKSCNVIHTCDVMWVEMYGYRMKILVSIVKHACVIHAYSAYITAGLSNEIIYNYL